jgi:hypothetical protein
MLEKEVSMVWSGIRGIYSTLSSNKLYLFVQVSMCRWEW